MEQEFKKTLEVEIHKRKQLSIEARVMFADVKKLSPFAQPTATGGTFE